MKKALGLLVLGALTLMAAGDPFIGTWKLDVAKSKYSPGPGLQSQTVTIGADKVEVSGVDDKGQAANWSYPVGPGPVMITGVPDASVIETRKGNTMEHTWKWGKAREKGHGVISKDGKTMTYTLTGTNAEGKKVNDKSVYEKQ
jgi:hypothetical protein